MSIMIANAVMTTPANDSSAPRCGRLSSFSGKYHCPHSALRCDLEHDPEKWIPVFGKDHAPHTTIFLPTIDATKKYLGWRS
jgi:hypothetical protein